MGLVIFVAMISLQAATTANLESYTSGNDLHRDCSVDRADSVYFSRMARCRAFIVGVHDAHTTYVSALNTDRVFCAPERMQAGQLTDVVRKWLTDNPKHRHKAAASLVLGALQENFPC